MIGINIPDRRRFKCPVCFKTYKYKSHLARHQNYYCGKLPSVKCPLCDYKTFRKDCLKSHLLSKKHLEQDTLAYLYDL